MARYTRIWLPMPKIVFSNTLREAQWNTRVVHGDNLVDEVTALRAQPGGKHVFYGGTDAAATLIAHDLIEEYWLFVHPIVLGGGPRLFHDLDTRISLELLETRTFPGGAVHLRYRSTH